MADTEHSSDDENPETPMENQNGQLSLDDLCYRVKEKHPFARQALEIHIKKLYRDHGGLSLKTSSLLPLDLAKITDDELINVADNMVAQLNKTKKADTASKILSSACALGRLITSVFGYNGTEILVQRLENDPVFKNSVMETVIGKNISPRPMVTLGLCLIEYGANICVSVLENGKHTADVRRAFRESDESSGTDTSRTPGDNEHNSSKSNGTDG